VSKRLSQEIRSAKKTLNVGEKPARNPDSMVGAAMLAAGFAKPT